MKQARRIVLAVLLFAFLGTGLTRLRFDTEVLALLPGELSAVRALVLQQRHFASAAELFITVRGDEADAVEEACGSLADRLRGAEGMARWVVWTSPWEERPDLAAELLAAAWLNAEPGQVRNLMQRLRPGPLRQHLEAARRTLATSLSPGDLAQAGYDPLGLLQVPGLNAEDNRVGPRFASDDGRFRIVMVAPPAGLAGYRDAIRWLGLVREQVAQWRLGDSGREGLRIRYTGGPAFAAEISQGMERDMRGSVLGTSAVIAALFFAAHRGLRPLLALLGLLALTLLLTLAMGGLVFGRLNAVSLGFAAILLGLTVDYGLVLYQEAVAYPGMSAEGLRRRVGRGILWAAVTTGAAFASLALGGLPGLTQLGVLVGCGAMIGATVMLGFFASPQVRGLPGGRAPAKPRWWLSDRWAWGVTTTLGVAAVLALAVAGLPKVDPSADPLRSRDSESHAALEEMQALVGAEAATSWWMVAAGRDEAAVAGRLRAAEEILRRQDGGEGHSPPYQLPTAFWPDPARQAQNRPELAALASDRARLQGALREAGFTDDAFRAAGVLLGAWARAGSEAGPFWPTNEVSAWVLEQFTAREAKGSHGAPEYFALGSIRPIPGPQGAGVLEDLRGAGLLVGGWSLLGTELLARVEHRLPWVGGIALVVWLGALGLTFRSLRETGLVVLVVVAGVGLLLGWMAMAGWRWNLMNLMALPLLVGAGTDYAIHLQLALRRYGGDLASVHGGTGRAVLLCAATTVAGFGSLALASNEGLASLGAVCAAGLCSIYLVSAHLLPAWWRLAHRGQIREGGALSLEALNAPSAPSTLYGSWAWRLALGAARVIPRPLLRAAASGAALAYAALVPARRKVVARNLLPLFDGDAVRSRRAVWRNFGAFGRKLADLWVLEAGGAVDGLFSDLTGWERFEAARQEGRGVLLLTPHLGNWELGAPLLSQRGVKLLVVTLAEPGQGLTEMRQRARARWGTETVVIQQDPFAFVAIIQRLQAGAVVALLVDRPPPATAVTVDLCGRPFPASVAAAELARASGCALFPTVILRQSRGYAAHLLPEVPYDRRQLGQREARRRLTGDIVRAFEPWVRQHPEQWFHFVNVWPDATDQSPGEASGEATAAPAANSAA